MRNLSILLCSALIMVTGIVRAAESAASSFEPAPKPVFQFSHATDIIFQCFNFVLVNKYGRTSQCMDMFLQLREWTRTERYADQKEVLEAIEYTTQANQLYVPVFTFLSNLDLFDDQQKSRGAALLRLALEKMGGFRGEELKFDNEQHASLITHFLIDALVTLSLNNVDTVSNIEFLNLMASRFEEMRAHYDVVIHQRVRFAIDYASAPEMKKMTLEQKAHYFAPFAMRAFKKEISQTDPLHFSDGVPLRLHMGWKGAAREMVVGQPALKVLEGLYQNLGNEIVDIEITQLEDNTFVKRPLQRLNEIGGWSQTVLERMGIELPGKKPRGGGDDGSGGNGKKSVESEVKDLCEGLMSPKPALAPIPVRSDR